MSYQMSDLLQLMVSEGGADLHIRVNIPPLFASTASSSASMVRRCARKTPRS